MGLQQLFRTLAHSSHSYNDCCREDAQRQKDSNTNDKYAASANITPDPRGSGDRSYQVIYHMSLPIGMNGDFPDPPVPASVLHGPKDWLQQTRMFSLHQLQLLLVRHLPHKGKPHLQLLLSSIQSLYRKTPCSPPLQLKQADPPSPMLV